MDTRGNLAALDRPTRAPLADPNGIAFGADGSMFVVDVRNRRIRRVDPAGIITTVAGNGTGAFTGDGGPATAASLKLPTGLAIDREGRLIAPAGGTAGCG